jgi:UDP-GlcNAc:undecaprenyl-phosphate GlcNAc-1-phosphate transferase
MQLLLGFFLAMSITTMLIPLLIRWAAPLGFLDLPGERKVHATPVPRVGGIAMVIAILAALLLWDAAARPMRALVFGVALLLGFGAWDDRNTLGSGTKFLGQALAAAQMMLWGGLSVATVTLTERMPLPAWLSAPLTLLFLLGGTNAFNLADGLDGLAGGMALLCLSGIALLAYTVGNTTVGLAAAVIAGALIGFLRFNTHPARVFMGDSGSQVLGFCAAVLAVLLTQDSRAPLSTALPLLLLGMPIIDTLMVMTERLMVKQSPFKADRRHIHHRLLALGFEHWEAVTVLYVLQGVLFVAAWFMRYDADWLVMLVFVVFAALVLLPLRVAQHYGWRIRRPAEQETWAVDTVVTRRGSYALPREAAHLLLGATLGIYAGWVLLCGPAPPRDLRLLAAGLGAVLLGTLLFHRHRALTGWAERVALYSSAAMAIFLSKRSLLDSSHPPLVECILFPLLALSVVVSIRTTASDRSFRVTPLDMLVLLLVVTVPNLPDSIASTRALGYAIAELVLLFYAVEALSLTSGHRWRWLTGGTALFLFGVAVRAAL